MNLINDYFECEYGFVQEKGVPLPKFGEWDLNDPASAEGYTVIFNKARNEKKTGVKIDSPSKDYHKTKYKQVVLGKPQSVCSFFFDNFTYIRLVCTLKNIDINIIFLSCRKNGFAA